MDEPRFLGGSQAWKYIHLAVIDTEMIVKATRSQGRIGRNRRGSKSQALDMGERINP